ncbi:hypothetical protein D3C75_1022630 [compost metagenome]
MVRTKGRNFSAQFRWAHLAQRGDQLFLQRRPVSRLRRFSLVKQGFNLTDRDAAFDPAFDLLNPQQVFVVKLTVPPFAALWLKQTIPALPCTQRDGVYATSFCYVANTVIGHRFSLLIDIFCVQSNESHQAVQPVIVYNNFVSLPGET